MGLESEIWDPEKLIPDPGVKWHRSTHHGTGSVTLILVIYTILVTLMCVNSSELEVSEQRCEVKKMFESRFKYDRNGLDISFSYRVPACKVLTTNEHMAYGNHMSVRG
jgi:hypothetical protein